MQLRKFDVAEDNVGNMTLKAFNTQYLMKNQPVKINGMANKWNATNKWNFNYLSSVAGASTSILSTLYLSP